MASLGAITLVMCSARFVDLVWDGTVFGLFAVPRQCPFPVLHAEAGVMLVALARWARGFQAQHGRPATLWFDKVCINQCAIAEDLECLPVFLAGCNDMLVLVGPTYMTRLWCVMELFVYMSMQDRYNRFPTVVCLELFVYVSMRVRSRDLSPTLRGLPGTSPEKIPRATT